MPGWNPLDWTTLGWIWLALLALFAAWHLRAWRRTRTMDFRRPVEALPRTPSVSLLVPAWNAREDLGPFVEAYAALAYPDKELILCVGGNDGGLERARELAADRPDVTVLEQAPGIGKQGGLELCYRASRGEVLYLTDIDCRVDDESFSKVLAPVASGREQVVTGSSRPADAQQRIGAVLVHWALVRKAEGTEGNYTLGILGRNCMVAREALEAIGGFSFAAPTGTDYRLAQELIAAGYRIWREPTSEIPTEYAWPLRTYVRKRGRWVRNVLLFAKRPEQNAEFRNALTVALLPAVMLVTALASLIAALWLPPALALLPLFGVVLMLLHGALNRLRYLRETLGPEAVSGRTVGGAFVNWLAQLWAGLYALYTWSVPRLRKQW